MSFGFSVGDFLAVGKLTLQLYRSFKDAPGEFSEISRQLSSFYIIIHDLEDQAQDATSLLNRRGTARKEELLDLCNNLQATLEELQGLYSRYKQMGSSAWLRFSLGQQDLTSLRSNLTLHIALIDQFMGSLTMSSIGRIEDRLDGVEIEMGRIFTVLQSLARSNRGKAQSILSAQSSDRQEIWSPLELELRTEGISLEFIRQHRDRIRALVGEVVREEGLDMLGDVEVGESASQIGPLVTSPTVSGRSKSLFTTVTVKNMPIVASEEDIKKAKRQLLGHGFNLKLEWKQKSSLNRRLNGVRQSTIGASLAGNISKHQRIMYQMSTRGDIYGQALCWAAEHGTETALRLVLQKGARVSGQDMGKMALFLAAKRGHEEIVGTLLDAGADVSARSRLGSGQQTALHAAAEHGHERVAALLLNSGADIEDRNCMNGYTPLYFAALYSQTTVIALLLKRGAIFPANGLILPPQCMNRVEKIRNWISQAAP